MPSIKETPPRAWGRPSGDSHLLALAGNTPTGVGKTASPVKGWAPSQKHPHGRGEDLRTTVINGQYLETPPRAWGRLVGRVQRWLPLGNTPTGVGKTQSQLIQACLGKKHPHGRGEDADDLMSASRYAETPPRAWGRRRCYPSGKHRDGNTPTGVGKTPTCSCTRVQPQKHPHGRGEDQPTDCAVGFLEETPPRAWGRLTLADATKQAMGNTPTGVGKTQGKTQIRGSPRKHPHGRGEDGPGAPLRCVWQETPPRAWGRPVAEAVQQAGVGNTPTGVGKTPSR